MCMEGGMADERLGTAPAAVCAAALCAGCALPGPSGPRWRSCCAPPVWKGTTARFRPPWTGGRQSAQLRYPLNGELLSPS